MKAPGSCAWIVAGGWSSSSPKAKRKEAEDELPYRLSARTVASSSGRSRPSDACRGGGGGGEAEAAVVVVVVVVYCRRQLQPKDL